MKSLFLYGLDVKYMLWPILELETQLSAVYYSKVSLKLPSTK